MKKIITAIGDPFVNQILSKEKNIEILGNDILYQEAIFEIIENNFINFLIINENIFNNLEIISKIKEIKKINKKIKIIIIINNQKNIVEKLKKEKNVYVIFNNINIKEKNYENKLIEKIKFIIGNNIVENYYEIKKEQKENSKFKISSIKENVKEIFNSKKDCLKTNVQNDFFEKKIITVIGQKNIGKSNVAIECAKEAEKKNCGKILIIDFNIYNQRLYSKFEKRKYPNKIYQRLVIDNFNKDRPKFVNKKIKNYYSKNTKKIFEDFTIKITNNIYLISGIDLIFNNNKKIEKNIFINFINEIKNQNNNYNIIIIYCDLKNLFDFYNYLLNISTKILLVIKPEILKIKEGNNIINKLKSINEDNLKKTNIFVNEYNKKSINFKIIKKIFKNIKTIKNIKKLLY